MKKIIKYQTVQIRATLIFIILLLALSTNHIYSQTGLKSKYTMGISANLLEDINLRDAEAMLQFWVQYFVENYEEVTEANVKIIKNTEELISTVNNKEIDMAMITSISYVQLSDRINLDPVIMSKFGSDSLFSLLFCSSFSQKIKSFNELENKHIIIAAGKFKKISELWLDLLCLENGIKNKENFFKKIDFVEKPMRAILPVFLNQADLCIVNDFSFESMKEMNPQISKSLEILYKRDDLSNDLICVRSDLGEGIKNLIMDRGLNHESLPRSDQVTTIFKADGALEFKPSYLDGVRSLYEEYKKLSVKK